MKLFIIVFTFFMLAIVGMAIGYIVAGKKLKGSCGGLGALMGEDCMFCSEKEKCEKKKSQEENCPIDSTHES